jgi:hypothetical protein
MLAILGARQARYYGTTYARAGHFITCRTTYRNDNNMLHIEIQSPTALSNRSVIEPLLNRFKVTWATSSAGDLLSLQ